MDALIGYLQGLQGVFVQLERGGPEACQGWLLSVQSDYLTLRSPEGADLHLPLHHIRSVTPLPPPPEAAMPADTGSALPATFAELLREQVGRRVRLYHAGPEVSAGRLEGCAPDHLLLALDSGETVCFTLFHLRSLYLPAPGLEDAFAEPSEPLQGG
jgi:hypothetical protein